MGVKSGLKRDVRRLADLQESDALPAVEAQCQALNVMMNMAAPKSAKEEMIDFDIFKLWGHQRPVQHKPW